MYQNQANVVTINCDFYLTRLCVIDFNGTFSTSTMPSLNIDVQIDKYLSIEKALMENLQLMNTTTGAAAALAAEVANVNAQVADSGIVVNGSRPGVFPTRYSGAQSVQPADTKGNDFLAPAGKSLQPWRTKGNNY